MVREGNEKPKIIVVDDEAELVELYASAFEYDGYEVVAAFGGNEAYEKIVGPQGPFDIVLSDIKMPKGNGIDLMRRLVENKVSIKIFLMTGYTEINFDELLAQGAIAVFSKPIDFNLLSDELKKHL